MAIGVASSRLMAYNAINALIDRGPAAARAEVSMAKAGGGRATGRRRVGRYQRSAGAAAARRGPD
jgi:hypothetical protein